MTRCFTVSSAASVPGERITLTVRAHDEGQVSKFLVGEAAPGQMVHLSQAQGDFTLDESPATPTNNHLLFITGGSGITPAMSILRTLLRDGYDGKAGRKITFLHYAQSPEDQIFADELAAIAAADNDVEVHLRYGEHVFSEFELRRLVPAFADTDTWACGPAGLMDPDRRLLRREPAAAHRVLQGTAHDGPAPPRARSASSAPARPPRTAAPRCSSRPRRWASSPSSAAAWASASPAPRARPRAPCATS